MMSTGRVATQVQKLGANNVPKTTLGRGSPPAPLQQSKDRQVNDLQRQLAQATQAIKSHPHGNGLYVAKAQAFTAGTTVVITHGLGRAFVGYEVKNIAGNYSRFQLVSNNDANLDKRQIKVQAEATCTADVWVF